jgi:hypothetical protein
VAEEILRCPLCGSENPVSLTACEGCRVSLLGIEPAPARSPAGRLAESSQPPVEQAVSSQRPVGLPSPVHPTALGRTQESLSLVGLVLTHGTTQARLEVTSSATLGREGDLRREFLACYPAISRRHVCLACHGPGQWTVTDTQSRHGTFVNDERLPPGVSRVLRSGDILRLADQVFVVSIR